MNKNYDRTFGPGGAYAWPADLDVAKPLIRVAPTKKSNADCLNEDFFHRLLYNVEEFLNPEDTNRDRACCLRSVRDIVKKH